MFWTATAGHKDQEDQNGDEASAGDHPGHKALLAMICLSMSCKGK